MNPAPPVIMIFLTSGSGSNFVLPFKTGASFHTPKSSKNFCDPLVAGNDEFEVSWNFADCGGTEDVETYMKRHRLLHSG